MSFEEELARLNEWHFFKEFTFSKTTFSPPASTEVELADNVISLGGLLIVFQLKERSLSGHSSAEAEKRWFDRAVMGRATKQVRDTLDYLATSDVVHLRNDRGHERELRLDSSLSVHKIVVYAPHEALPEECRRIKHHTSKTAGLIHLFQAVDYLGVLRTLLTPAEMADYLEYRASAIATWPEQVASLPEQALLGQFLSGDDESPPEPASVRYLVALDHRAAEWDMSGVIAAFPDRIVTDHKPMDYYPIIEQIALLFRNELRAFKERFELSLQKAQSDEATLPYRITIPRRDCGFVFVPLTREMAPYRENAATNMTLLHKYDQRVNLCLGVTIEVDEHGPLSTWCFVEFPWESDPDLEAQLADNFPFREAKPAFVDRYTYVDNANSSA